MKFEDISNHDQGKYSEKCICGIEHVILSQQKSIYCEYEHNVYLLCQCGEYVQFILSVN